MRLILTVCLAALFLACTGDRADAWKPLDLTGHNVAVSILAPDSAKVASRNLSGVIHDVTIKSPADDYSVQVLGSQAVSNDMARLKSEQLDLVRSGRYFERIVSEEPNGFVFENRIDSTSIYGFRYIVYQGDQQFVFQNGMEGTFDLPQVEAMYAAVKQDK